MFFNVINAGKEFANKLSNKFLNLSDVEMKVKDATNDDKWGPNGTLMKEIADETFSTNTFQDVMTFLWYRLFTEKPVNTRRIYKGLVLLSYLIINGSDFVATSCKAHLHDLMKLKSFNDPNGVADISIRRKADDICDLLNDSERLAGERQRAQTYKTRYYHSETSAGTLSCDSTKTNAQSLGNFDDWEPESKSIPYVIGESFMNFVSTFTQNISGPPPTETHDNFEIHQIDNEKCEDAIPEKLQYKPSINTQKEETRKKSVPKIDLLKPVIKNPEVISAPIIDFSEPVGDSIVVHNNTNTSNFNNGQSLFPTTSNNDNIDAEFGNLRGWNNVDVITPISMPSTNPVTDFRPNFDELARSNTWVSTETTPQMNKTEPDTKSQQSTTPKREMKVGATWNDLDSLNIDLNNLCGRKHVYSKS